MTETIVVESRLSGGVYDLDVKGHAGSAPHGRDLICAAASILVYTVAAELVALKKRGAARIDIWDVKPGKVHLQAEGKDFSGVEAIERGFALLAEQNPDFVRIQ